MAYKLALVSCVYADPKIEEKKNRQRIERWFLSSTTEEEFKKLDLDYSIILPPLIGSRDDNYTLVGKNGLKIPYTDMVSKTIVIQNKFKDILDEKLDDEGAIIYFDGDGQVDESMVFKILSELKNNDFVMCCRGTDFGVSVPRVKVERFENFLVSEKFKIGLPDAQCGCWGFKTKFLKKLFNDISAQGFEIELNILILFLMAGIVPSYVPIKLIKKKNVEENKEQSTTYDPKKDDLKKIKFLLEMLKWDHTTLKEKQQAFNIKTKIILPSKYVDLFEHPDVKEINRDIKIEEDYDETHKKAHICSHYTCEKHKLDESHICYEKGKIDVLI